jgi:hypothetical protein
VYVYSEARGGWHRVVVLMGSETVVGDQFGVSVAASDDTIAAGAVYHGNDTGRAYVFSESRSGWKQVGVLVGADTRSGDLFGSGLAIAGNLIAVGATGCAGGRGRAYLFDHSGTGWHQIVELPGTGTRKGAGFAGFIGLSSRFVGVGAEFADNSTGAAYVFQA